MDFWASRVLTGKTGVRGEGWGKNRRRRQQMPGAKALCFHGPLFVGLKPPAPSERQRQRPIRRFWLRQNDEPSQATATAEICGRKGRAVEAGRASSGSFALERRAQDDSKNRRRQRRRWRWGVGRVVCAGRGRGWVGQKTGLRSETWGTRRQAVDACK